ncbi:hypothetical protein ACHQM5_024210 [Ranunculus cassubicifolius]
MKMIVFPILVLLVSGFSFMNIHVEADTMCRGGVSCATNEDCASNLFCWRCTDTCSKGKCKCTDACGNDGECKTFCQKDDAKCDGGFCNC